MRGLAVYNRKTLGGYWRVQWPNGRTTVERQVDIGPAPWTHRSIDFTSAAIRAAGYTEKNYPTDAKATITYLGKTKPASVPTVRSGGGAAPMAYRPSLGNSMLKSEPYVKLIEAQARASQKPVKAAVSAPRGSGSIRYQSGTPGLSHPSIEGALRDTSSILGQPLIVGTTTNHDKYTVNGNVSDHYSGNAADVPATGQALIRMGQAALQALGMNPAEARRQTGGLFNLNKNGKRYQVIFNTQTGGDHTNHLHIGVR
ncbi:MAG: hypothetical protein EBT03_08520 [Betaproteobacteria bacterium]|nr:hypothetical protein [Betaproteobacteria bacterium]